MASNPGKWEIVGKDGKPRKNTAGNKKSKAKINEADLPKLDIKAPIPESKTQFDAFNKKEPDSFVVPKQESSDNDSDGRASSRHEGKNRKAERKNKPNKEQQPSFSAVISEALNMFDSSSVTDIIAECKQNYPNHQLVLLKELTGCLQKRFIKMPVEKDPVLGNQAIEFPLCCVSSEVQDHISEELKLCSEDDVDKFYSYCLDELITELNKGHATYGVRIMIQCVLKCFPFVAIKNRKQYLQRVITRKDNPREALSLLWAYGQTSEPNDVEERLTVWTSFFLPVITSKQQSKYVVDYLEVTLSLELPDRFVETPVSGKKFQRIMELAHGSNFLNFPYRRQLQLLYPELKAIVFNARPPNASLTKVFYVLFDSLGTDLGREYSREVLECLVKCLEKDATCHYEWRNNYLGRFKESSLLLKSIIANWESICRSVPRKYLVETLQEFQEANIDLKEREKPKAGLVDCEASCKKLLDMISSTPENIPTSGSSWLTKICMLLLCIVLFVVCVDLFKHDGYEGSTTSKVLKQTGVEKVSESAYKSGRLYAYQFESWSEKHYPYYYKKVRDVVEPACDYTMTILGDGLLYLDNVTTPARLYIHKNVPPLLEKLDRFVTSYFKLISKALLNLWADYFPIVMLYLKRVWATLVIWVPRVFSRAQELALNTFLWFYNLSPDFFDALADGFGRLVNEVVKKTPHILALVQEYMLTAWTLLAGYLSDVVLWVTTSVSN